MKKIILLVIIVIFSLLVLIPSNTYSLDFNNNFIIHKLDDNTGNNVTDNYNKNQNCSGLLGDPNDEDSVAWLLQTILNYLRVLGPILVVVLSSVDFAKVIVNGDDEKFSKAKKTLFRRLIIVALLFLVPTIVSVLLNLFGITSNPTCGII